MVLNVSANRISFVRFAMNSNRKFMIIIIPRQIVTAFTSNVMAITRLLRLYHAASIHSITRVRTPSPTRLRGLKTDDPSSLFFEILSVCVQGKSARPRK